MKHLRLFLPFVLLYFSFSAKSQNTCCPGESLGGQCLGTETFESYTPQSCNLTTARCFNNWWTWPANPLDASNYVRSNLTTDAHYQGFRSLVVKPTASGGLPDLLKDLFDVTSGIYRLSWKMKVPTGKIGYYNIQHDMQELNKGRAIWAYQVFFNDGGINLMVAGEKTTRVGSYQPDCWLKVTQVINLDQDSVELFVDNRLIRKWAFSPGIIDVNNDGISDGLTKLKKLGAINFYTKDNFEYYIDQLCYQQAPTPKSGGPCVTSASLYCLGGTRSYRPTNACFLPAYDGYVEGEEVLLGSCRTTSSACTKAIPIACNQTLNNQTTQGAGSDFSSKDFSTCTPAQNAYYGSDKVYRISISEPTSLQIKLNILDPGVNLDVFLLQNCQTLPAPAGGFGISGGSGCSSCVASSTDNNPSTTQESISAFLEPGVYYIIVDGLTAATAGRFNISVDCSCSCVEGTDIPLGLNTLCENFDGYTDGGILTQSNRWAKWEAASYDASITTTPGQLGKQLRFQRNGTIAPDLLLSLDNKTTGRYRISWNMYVNKGQAGYYNFQHTNAGGANPQWAYEVFFRNNSNGELRLRNKVVAQFNYANGASNKVMQIIDLDKDLAELWINDQMVFTWRFSIGNPSDSRQLGGINFYAGTDHNFTIDNICVWSKNTDATCNNTAQNPICLTNGKSYANETAARCDLYTRAEFGGCASVCDIGGTMVGRGDRFSGNFGLTDRAPNLVMQDSLVRSFYKNQLPDSLFGHVYVFYNDGPNLFNISLSTTDNIRAFVYRCPQDIPGKSANLLGYRCIGMDGQNFSESGYYYILILGNLPNTNYAFTILPEGNCRSNSTPIVCNTATALSLSGSSNWYSYNSGGINAYQSCYTGGKTYAGEDREFQFKVDKPSKVYVTLQSTTAMGVFMYNYLCGSSCLTFAETPDNGATVRTDTLLLDPGIYYLIVDKATLGGVSNFNLTINCSNATQPAFVSDAVGGKCPVSSQNLHTVTLRSLRNSKINGGNLTPNDQIYFFYRKTSVGALLANTIPWNGTEVKLALNEDAPGDTTKCGYAVAEPFIVKVNRNGVLYEMHPYFQPVDGTTVTATSNFQRSGSSLITGLANCCRPSALRVSPTAKVMSSLGGKFDIQIASNLAWNLNRATNDSWLKVSQTRGASNSLLTVELAPNNTGKSRTDTLYIRGGGNELEKVVIEQNSCAALAVNISGDQNVCLGKTATLTASGGGSIQWSNGATTPSITVTPAATTVYSVTATQGGCSNTSQIRLVVIAPPVVDLGPDRTICSSQSITLGASGGDTYLWSTGETSPSITVRPEVTTGYSVAVSRNGCVGSDQVQINVGSSIQPVISPDVSICAGESTTLTVSGALSYSWSTGANTFRVNVKPEATTTYRVTLSDANGCTTTAQTTVTVKPLPSVNIGADLTICPGEKRTLTATGEGSFRWNTGETSRSIQINPTANATYSITVTNNGCTATDEVNVQVFNRLQVNLGPDRSICPGQLTDLIAPQGSAYLWSNGATTPSITVSPFTNTVYSVTVTKDGCTASNQVQVLVVPIPFPDAGPDLLISCNTGQVQLQGSLSSTVGVTYAWQALNGGKIVSGENTLTPKVNRPGVYRITVTTLSGGCSAIDEVAVNGTPLVEIASIGLLPVRCPGDATGSIEITVTGGQAPYQYTWSNGGNASALRSIRSGKYSVTVADKNDCRDTATVELKEPTSIRLDKISVFPSTLGNNGSVNITVRGGLPPYQYKWYSKNGVVIATSEDISSLAPGDYVVEITDDNGCAFRSSPIKVSSTTTGLDDFTAVNHLLLYPNPTNGKAYLDLELSQEENVQIAVFNMLGQELFRTQKIRDRKILQELDVSEMAGGLYQVRVVIGEQQALTRPLLLIANQ
jgi:hypothetical protein